MPYVVLLPYVVVPAVLALLLCSSKHERSRWLSQFLCLLLLAPYPFILSSIILPDPPPSSEPRCLLPEAAFQMVSLFATFVLLPCALVLLAFLNKILRTPLVN